MAAFVISIQKHTITLPAGTASVSTALTGTAATNEANCIPIITKRLSTPNASDPHTSTRMDVSFDGSGNLVCETGIGTTRVAVAEISVVEFDDTYIDVQHGTMSLISTELTDVVTLGTAVTQSASFIVHAWMHDNGGGSSFDFTNLGCELNAGGTALTFTREDGTAESNGHWFLAEAKTGEWTAQHSAIDITTGQENTATITAVDSAKTFLTGSIVEGSGNDNEDSTMDVVLTAGASTTTITGHRHQTTGTTRWRGQAVTFTGNEEVYRGTIDQTTAVATDTDTISTAITIADSTVHTAGNITGASHGSFPGVDSTDIGDAHCAWTITGTTEVTLKHDTTGGEPAGDNNYISWEVIQWEIQGGAPPATRRVMVIS